MSKRRNKFLDIRVQFFFICMAGFIGVALLATLAPWGLEHLGINVPTFVWLLIFTLLLGSATAAGFSVAFFAPISRLSRAMKEVADGNFHVKVETKSIFRDIRDIYDNFDLMVRELSATETLQTDFISNVSHEFKTPISAIEGYASLLQEHQQSREEQDEYIDKILFNTRRLSALAGNILLLSKLDSQSIHPQRERFRLDEQVRQSILALERKWTEKEVDFDVDLDEIEFTGYEGLLQHVWSNLIDNAIKFSPHGGLIRMRMLREDGHILFTIDNEGPSIPDADKARIFNKFYQGDSSHESEGNGLGLSLVRKIVTMHGGEVRVEDPVNGGCRFAVTLPFFHKVSTKIELVFTIYSLLCAILIFNDRSRRRSPGAFAASDFPYGKRRYDRGLSALLRLLRGFRCRVVFHRQTSAEGSVPRGPFPLPLRSLGGKALPRASRARLAGQGARHEQDRPQAHPREKARLRLSRAASAHDRRDLRR